jgi:hypothetical protein
MKKSGYLRTRWLPINAGTIPVPESGGFDDNGQEPSIRLLDSSILVASSLDFISASCPPVDASGSINDDASDFSSAGNRGERETEV